MNAQQALKNSLDLSSMVVKTYLSDLSDADFLRRPAPGCNHIAWQLGHLISSEVSLLESICPGKAAKLPDGFAAKHSKETAASDDSQAFLTRQQYLDLFDSVRAASAAAIEACPSEDFDKPAPERLRAHFPTVGMIFTLIATHPLMHAGQFVVVRRQLGKPVLI